MRFKKSIFVVSIKYLCPALFLFTSPFCKNELQKLNEDVESATFTALPRDNATLQDLTQIEISFSDLMRGMTVLSNYKISGTGAASLQPSAITDLGGNRVRLTLSGFPKTGSFFLTLSNIADSKNRPLAQSVLSYNLVIPGPTISTSPTENSVLSSLTQLDVTFSLPVNAAATQTSSYNITNASGGSLVVDSVSQLTTTSYRLVISGNLGNGTFTLHTTGIESLAGNAPQNPNLSFVADSTAPSVVSSTPTGGTTLANLDNLTIQFSEAVENAGLSSSYALSGTGKGSLSISSINSLGSNNFQLNFSGSPANGAIEISLSGIRDLAGNLLGSTVLNFTGDTVNPTITGSSTASGSTINALTSLDITYSRAVNGGANLGNYSLSGTGVGSLAITNVTNLSGNIYRLVFSGSPINGSIQISISGISATANALPLVSGSLTYNVDLGLPTIVSSTPTAGTLLNSLTQLDIVYSEVMSNAGNAGSYSISNNGSGSLSVVSVTNISGNQYRLTLSGTVGNGSFSVTSNATDLAGNSNAANVLNFNADNTTPSILSATPANSSSLNALTTIDFTFSEAVSGASNSGNYSLTGAGAVTLSISGVLALGGNSYRVNIAGTPQNGTINLAMANISDTAGNTISGTVLTYTGDFSGPTATTNPPNSGFISSLTTLDITYSEPVVNATTLTNYSISGSGQGSLTLQSVNHQGGNVYRLTFTGTPVNGTLSLNISNILDSFGNALTTTAFTYTTDIASPGYTVSNPSTGTMVNALPSIQINYTEPMLGAGNSANYTLSGAGTGSLAVNTVTALGGNAFRLNFSGTISNGTVNVTLAANITDNAGNPPASNSFSLTGDIIAPTQTSNPVARKAIGNSLTSITFTFSEPVLSAADSANYIFSGPGAGTLAVASINTVSSSIYQINLTGTPAQGVFTVTLANITDIAGNALSGTTLTLVAGYSKYRRINILNSGITVALPNFPVAVIVNASRIDYSAMQANGIDIAFYDNETEGFNKLSHEIEHWNAAGNSLIWVRVPSITANSNADFFYMYYGNPSGTDSQNASAVWDTFFRAVHHFNLPATANQTDSTSFAHNAVPSGMVAGTLVNTPLGRGLNFDGIDDMLTIADTANLRFTGNLTISMWVNWNSAPLGTAPLVEKGGITGIDDDDNYSFFLKNVSPGRMSIEFMDNTSNLRSFSQGSQTVNTGSWVHLLFRYNGTNIRFYQNGALQDEFPAVYTLKNTITLPLLIGRNNNGGVNYFFNGIMDEVRISSTPRTAAWAEAEYKSGADTYLSYGPEL